MTATLIVPGLNGSGEGHWQDIWLKEQPETHLVNQHDWRHPDLSEWLGALEHELIAHPGALLVAHSLGALLAAHLAGRPAADHVAGALLVAPCDLDAVERLHPGLVSFGEFPTKPLPFPSILAASSNDPYLPHAQAHRMAATWGSGLIDMGDAGHINIASGHGRWTDGYLLAASLGGERPRI
ncbi:alpha/beta hydrolase [Mesorhizobium sp. CAU 1732]|uniref:RBBP9/YdeN family alpha/beta hydrolase n=1 Tax=Mesorhizobium sp. CAU 1732 TaxID=3140358 RepID=UPI0032614C5A